MGDSYKLPEEMRERLAKPMGRLFASDEVQGDEFLDALKAPPMVITVGDRVTETAGKLGRVPDVQVVDGLEKRVARPPPDLPFKRLITAKNPPGTITTEAIEALRKAFEGEKPVRVLIEGEEDLLAIPAIALSPLSATLFYGQPNEGIVAVRVGSDTKSRNRGILAEMGITELR